MLGSDELAHISKVLSPESAGRGLFFFLPDDERERTGERKAREIQYSEYHREKRGRNIGKWRETERKRCFRKRGRKTKSV